MIGGGGWQGDDEGESGGRGGTMEGTWFVSGRKLKKTTGA